MSQGNGDSRDAAGKAHWSSAGPMDEIYLVGGPLVRYQQMAGAGGAAGAVEALVYLRQDDAALAGRYLAATAQYLEMYGQLIGPYPYGKFALVENFWETGYGMASFTLLGPQVIRMPFILASSYPHEILHNWWGNSVFVDYATGNWCEGLTAYMADHLMREQLGQGAAYRRDRLQDYASYVRDGRDFPLTEFRSRHSAATEAVGYGKALMGFHMLRRQLGDERFREWAARFYREERGRKASFADLRRTLEAAAGKGTDLGRFFHDWTERPGAAALAVEGTGVRAVDGGFEVRGTLRQTQAGEPFALDVPLVIQTTGAAVVATVHLEAAATAFALHVAERPVALEVDPSFDLFRRLDPREIPASIGQLFGAPRLLAVVATQASAEEAAAWRTLMESWKTEAHAVEVQTDTEVTELPADRAVWLLGSRNRLAERYFGRLEGRRRRGAHVGCRRRRCRRPAHSVRRSHHRRGRPPPGERRACDRLDHRRSGASRGASRPEPETSALRQVQLPRLRRQRADEQGQGAMGDDGHAAARRPAATGERAARRCPRSSSSRAGRSPSCRRWSLEASEALSLRERRTESASLPPGESGAACAGGRGPRGLRAGECRTPPHSRASARARADGSCASPSRSSGRSGRERAPLRHGAFRHVPGRSTSPRDGARWRSSEYAEVR